MTARPQGPVEWLTLASAARGATACLLLGGGVFNESAFISTSPLVLSGNQANGGHGGEFEVHPETPAGTSGTSSSRLHRPGGGSVGR